MSPKRRLAPATACGAALALAACGGKPFDRATQIGANPALPAAHQYLLPPMRLAPVVGWKPGEHPTVPGDLRVTAMATGLEHPRSVYTLPNGDVLVIESKGPNTEPVERPKDLVMNWVEGLVTSSGKKGGPKAASNRITLLRDANGDGAPELRIRCSWTTCTRPSAWPWSATTSTSPIPTPSCATPTPRARRA